MAAGVENAACVVCFLSQQYQDSENCKLELKFAKQNGVPIVPVMVARDPDWRPSGCTSPLSGLYISFGLNVLIYEISAR